MHRLLYKTASNLQNDHSKQSCLGLFMDFQTEMFEEQASAKSFCIASEIDGSGNSN
jgi:hypothetical protein